MKKLIVTLTVMGIMVGSIATLSSASRWINDLGYGNRYNGSYYYDIGWGNVTAQGDDTTYIVDVSIKKNGTWKAHATTRVRSTAKGNTVTCYSGKLQGSGANGVSVEFLN